MTVDTMNEADSGLAGKVAIVTGGGAAGEGIGNGRAAAILLARAGTSVLVVDRVRQKDGAWREFGRSTLSRTLPPA